MKNIQLITNYGELQKRIISAAECYHTSGIFGGRSELPRLLKAFNRAVSTPPENLSDYVDKDGIKHFSLRGKPGSENGITLTFFCVGATESGEGIYRAFQTNDADTRCEKNGYSYWEAHELINLNATYRTWKEALDINNN